MYIIYQLEKKRITADTPNASTTPKECAATAIIATVEPKSHGIALTRNYMQMECARIVTSTATIRREEKKRHKKNMNRKFRI